MIKQITITDVIDRSFDVLLIDVRTPNEFEQFHIPGAINIPLFSNEERAVVGTLFKQESPQVAIDRGLELVAPKLPEMYKQVKAHYQKKRDIVVYCWRGGMRSRSVATFMDMMGIPCKQLTGGIRAFRKRITSDLEEVFAPKETPFVVLEGLTGTRKTDMLLKLQEEGYPVIDLEGLANHRGSIFGAVGKKEKSQKAFEKDLWLRLRELGDVSYYLIEGESRRLGRIMLPDFIVKGKEKGVRLVTQYPFQKRVEAIYAEYNPSTQREELYQAFQHLKRYLTPSLIEEMEDAFAAEDDHRIIARLLESYYDPKYEHSHSENEGEQIHIPFETLEEGLDQIRQALKQQVNSNAAVLNAF